MIRLIPHLFGALLAGALAVFSFAPFNYWPLTFVSVFILLKLIEGRTPGQGFGLGFTYGMGLFLAGVWWIHVSMTRYGGLSLPLAATLILLLSAYLSLYKGLTCYLLNRFFAKSHWSRYLLAFPVLWVIGEWLQGWVLTGFPWLWLGYSQIETELAGWAPLLGVEGVTLMLCISTASLYLCWQRHTLRYLLLPVVLFAAGYGFKKIHWTTPGQPVSIAMVQGNIPQEMKWDPSFQQHTIDKYLKLSEAAPNAKVLIWPESALPTLEQYIPKWLSAQNDRFAQQQRTLITGVIHYDTPSRSFYNAMIVLGQYQPDSPRGYRYNGDNRYYKHHLVPIGEYVPFRHVLKGLGDFFDLPMSSFSEGDYKQPNLIAAGYRFASAICYEIAFPEQLRSNVDSNTDFILTLSNDGWFGRSIGPQQHMEIARMRALELGRVVLRATNTGVTGVINSQGVVVQQLPLLADAVLNAQVTPEHGLTPYNRFGSWPLYIWAVFALLSGFAIHRFARLR